MSSLSLLYFHVINFAASLHFTSLWEYPTVLYMHNQFQRLDGRSASSPIHAATTALTSSGITPTHTQQPYSRPQRDGLVSRRDKSITSLLQQRGFGKQREGADHKASSTEKALPTKVAYVQPSSQDEDVCPTCLDGNFTILNLIIVNRMCF